MSNKAPEATLLKLPMVNGILFIEFSYRIPLQNHYSEQNIILPIHTFQKHLYNSCPSHLLHCSLEIPLANQLMSPASLQAQDFDLKDQGVLLPVQISAHQDCWGQCLACNLGHTTCKLSVGVSSFTRQGFQIRRQGDRIFRSNGRVCEDSKV